MVGRYILPERLFLARLRHYSITIAIIEKFTLFELPQLSQQAANSHSKIERGSW